MRLTAVSMLLLTALLTLAAAEPAVAAQPQSQRFTATIDVSTGEATVVASGVINATGVGVETSTRQAGRTQHATDDLVFGAGTIHIKTTAPDRSTFDPSTCTLTVDAQGPWAITGGDGDYAGIKGNGRFTASGTIQFEQTDDGCDFEHASGTETIDAVGDVKL
jgi:opacity protein-like surface antigen